MKTTSKLLTESEILAFIMGVQTTTECGDKIDEKKQLTWHVFDCTEAGVWLLKATWIKGITYAKVVSDPQLQNDNIVHEDDYRFQVLVGESNESFCSTIIDAIDYVNSNEFNED